MQNPLGVLHSTLGSSVQEDLMGVSPEKGHKIVSEVKYCFYLERLRELQLFILKKIRLQGHLIEAFQYV